jgi:GNAT superfamily N-acetyltransferase
MSELNLVFKRLGIDDERFEFDCGDKDLNEFFAIDSKDGTRELVSVTYAVLIEEDSELVGFFCVSNDAIRKQDTTNNKFNRIRSKIPSSKRYSSMPAVKIGRLAIARKYQNNKIGKKTLDLIKMWFTDGNKTGCRFIIVDAINTSKVLAFYKNNGFDFLDSHSASDNDKTRLMFFDLLTFAPS